MSRPINWFFLAAPVTFYPVAGRLSRWFAVVAALFTAAGLIVGFGFAPDDWQQGSVYRIIFIHVPAAWLSMIIYLVMAGYGVLALTFNTRLSSMMALALAPTGAWCTVIALVTGSVWGRPTWGTWWVWDARLTSELILLFLYLGVLALHHAHSDVRRADRAVAVLSIIGAINVPIIYFSVRWWNTLHQGASVSLTAAPQMAKIMLTGMLLATIGLWCYACAVAFSRVRVIILERERGTQWLRATGP